VIRGERDLVAPAEHADALMRDLSHARSKESVIVPSGTHFLQFEPGREQLFEAVEQFLRRAPEARVEGR
jgi:pimeloyl-ACP methyl ester carboxylesterase